VDCRRRCALAPAVGRRVGGHAHRPVACRRRQRAHHRQSHLPSPSDPSGPRGLGVARRRRRGVATVLELPGDDLLSRYSAAVSRGGRRCTGGAPAARRLPAADRPSLVDGAPALPPASAGGGLTDRSGPGRAGVGHAAEGGVAVDGPSGACRAVAGVNPWACSSPGAGSDGAANRSTRLPLTERQQGAAPPAGHLALRHAEGTACA
jgi:hypothetical protein